MALARDDCNVLMSQIMSRCDAVFGHRETHSLSAKKCGTIRFDNNDSPVEIHRKIEELRIRSSQFHNCGDIRTEYTNHKPPCNKSSYDLTDTKHILYNQTLKKEGNYCDTYLQRFIDTVNRNVLLYKANPARRDLSFMRYVIYLYEKNKAEEEQKEEQMQLDSWKKSQTLKYQETARQASLELKAQETLEKERKKRENFLKKKQASIESEKTRKRVSASEAASEATSEATTSKSAEKKSQTKRNVKIAKLLKKFNIDEISEEFLIERFPDEKEFIHDNYNDIRKFLA